MREMYITRNKIRLLLLLSALLLAVGCHHRPTMREMGIVLDTLRINDCFVPLTDSLPEPNCEFDIELITLANAEYSALNDSLLRSGILTPEYLSLTDTTLTPREAVDSFIERYAADYRTFFANIFLDEGDADAVSKSYQLATSIGEGRDSVLCYEAHITQKEGAVQNTYTICKNMDLAHCRLLTLDDVFVHGSDHGLSEAIAAQLLRQTAKKSLSELHDAGFFVGTEVYPTPNFLLGDKSVTFVYVPGEIADRDKGEIRVEVKYANIKHLLKR